jgi:hypothetical protein
MTAREIESAINKLCLSGQLDSLYRILKPFDGAYQILISDKTGEQKKQELLGLLKMRKGRHGI